MACQVQPGLPATAEVTGLGLTSCGQNVSPSLISLPVMRRLATFRRISGVRPIPDADAIECAVVDGWEVVIKKAEYKVGDIACYLEIDSWVPLTLAPFLAPKKNKCPEFNGVEGNRLTTVKLRGQLSQGLLLPLRDVGPILTKAEVLPANWESMDLSKDPELFKHDLTEPLGIQKWEKPEKICEAGDPQKYNPFPAFLRKTDQERIQNEFTFLTESGKLKEKYEITVKMDGSSCTIFHNGDGYGVCSRNLEIEENEANSFWSTVRNQKIIEGLESLGLPIALQGEMVGEKIQGNVENIKGKQFFLFDIYHIAEARTLRPPERMEIFEKLTKEHGVDMEHVPVVDVTTLEHIETINQLLDMAEGPSYNPKVKREGIVCKSLDSYRSFKVISNSYLLKHKDR